MPRSFALVGKLQRAAIFLALFGVVACSQPDAGTRLKRGDEFFAKKEFAAALVEYRAAVQADQLNGRARQKLALVYFELNDRERATREIVRAADLLPDDATVQLAAGRALLADRKYDDAKARAERVLAKQPKNADAQILRGNASAGLHDFESALTDLTEAAEALPGRAATQINLAAIRTARGENAEAEAAYKQAIVVAPASAAGYVALSRHYAQRGRAKDAEEVLLQGKDKVTGDSSINTSLAALYLRSGRRAEAEAPLKELVASSNQPAYRLALADYYVAQKRVAEAKTLLTGLASDKTANGDTAATARTRLASIEYDGGNRPLAYKMLDELIAERSTDAQLRLLKSEWRLAERNIDGALEEARAAERIRPESPRVQLQLGRLLTQKDPVAAIKASSEALRLSPGSTEAMVQLAQAHFSRGEFTKAQQFASDALALDPGESNARFNLAKALLAQGKLAETEQALQPLLKAFPASPYVQVLHGRVRLRAKDVAGAKAAYEKALRADPGFVDAVAGLAALETAQNRTNEARALVSRAIENNPSDPALRILRAKLLLATKDQSGAENELRAIIQSSPGNYEAFQLLGQLYFSQKRLPDALRQFEALAKQNPASVPAHTMVGMLQGALGNKEAAETSYKRVLSLNPRASIAANNLAYLYAEQNRNLDEALSLAQAAVSAQPDSADMNDTLGWVFFKRGMAPLAVGPLRRSTELDPQDAEHHYHLGLATAKAGDETSARAALQKSISLGLAGSQREQATATLAALPR